MDSVVKNHHKFAMKLLNQNKFTRRFQSIINLRCQRLNVKCFQNNNWDQLLQLSVMQKLDKIAFNRYSFLTTEVLVESISGNLMKFTMSIKCSHFKRH